MREAQRVATTFHNQIQSDSTPDTIRVIVGCGWGYIVEELLRLQSRPAAAPSTSSPIAQAGLVFFEPLSEVYDLLNERGRLDELRSLGATITNDPADLRQVGVVTLTLLITPGYQRLFPDLESILRRELGPAPGNLENITDTDAIATADKTRVDQATGSRFLRQWTRNGILRLRSGTNAESTLTFLSPPDPIETTETTETIEATESVGSADNRPATDSSQLPGPAVLFCGAGPRLLRDLGLATKPTNTADQATRILQLRSNYYIIAADTALAPLLRVGLTPDLVISIDSGPGTYYHLIAAARLPDHKHSRFPFPVLTNLAGSRCLSLFFTRHYYYRSTFPLDQWLALGPLAEVPELRNPTRNTIGLAIQVARLLGGKQIRTAGADFQNEGYLTHVPGTGYTEFALGQVDRLYTLEMYRPGGYSKRWGEPGRTEKNELSYQSAREMAAAFQIELTNFTNLTRGAFEAEAADPPRELPAARLRSVPIGELKDFLIQTRPRLNQEIFANWQIQADHIDRWFQTLN